MSRRKLDYRDAEEEVAIFKEIITTTQKLLALHLDNRKGVLGVRSYQLRLHLLIGESKVSSASRKKIPRVDFHQLQHIEAAAIVAQEGRTGKWGPVGTGFRDKKDTRLRDMDSFSVVSESYRSLALCVRIGVPEKRP